MSDTPNHDAGVNHDQPHASDTSANLRLVAIFLAIVAALGGFALGNAYKVVEVYEYIPDTESFNWSLAVPVWINGAILGALFGGLASIAKMLEQIKTRLGMTPEQHPAPKTPLQGTETI